MTRWLVTALACGLRVTEPTAWRRRLTRTYSRHWRASRPMATAPTDARAKADAAWRQTLAALNGDGAVRLYVPPPIEDDWLDLRDRQRWEREDEWWEERRR